MRRLHPCLLLPLLVLGGGNVRGDGDLVLDRDSNISITTSGAFDNAGFVLADMLRRHLALALRRESLSATGMPVSIEVIARHQSWSEIPRSEISTLTDIDAFTITVETEPAVIRIAGATPMAAGYGVTHFLEQLGIRWLFPGDLGLALPAASTFRLAAGTTASQPFFASRMFTGLDYRDPQSKNIYEGVYHRQRLYFRAYDYQRSLRLHSLSYASHNLVNVFDVTQFGTTEPELYPLRNGERFIPPTRDSLKGQYGRWSAWHPCYTNPRVTKIAIEKARAAFAAGSHTFSLGINDGQRYQCECLRCREAGWPNAYYNFLTAVAEAVLDQYPPHLIGFLIYGDVRQPPVDLVLPANVMAMVTGSDYAEWADRVQHLGTYEYMEGAGFVVPCLPFAAMAHNAKLHRAQNIRFLHNEAYPVWAFDAPKLYIRARQLWQPELDLEACLAEFCNAAAGAGGTELAAYYRHWATLEQRELQPSRIEYLADLHLWQNVMLQFARVSESDYQRGNGHLTAALALAETERQRGRLHMVQEATDLSRAMFGSLQMARRIFVGDDAFDWRQAATESLAAEADLRARLARAADRPEWFAGASGDADAAWGEVFRNSLAGELMSAQRTALLQLGGDFTGIALPADLQHLATSQATATTPKIILRSEHPWYPPERCDAMTVTPRDGFAFSAVPATPAAGNAGMRKQFVAALVIDNEARRRGTFYQHRFSFTGQHGELTIRLQVGSRNRARSLVAQLETFAAEPQTLQRRYTVEPLLLGGEESQELIDLPVGSKFPAHLYIYLEWQPTAGDAELSGSCRIERIDYDVEAGPEAPSDPFAAPAKPTAEDPSLELDLE